MNVSWSIGIITLLITLFILAFFTPLSAFVAYGISILAAFTLMGLSNVILQQK